MLITALVFLLVLSVLVLIHEVGHFLVAKKMGVKVEEFGFGLPPRVFGIQKGETLYSINALPIGGFVKLYGEDEAGAGKVSLPVSSSKHKASSIKKEEIHNTKYKILNTDLKRAFFARPAWQRSLIVIAGVLMNFILAVVIISYLFTVQGVAIPGNKVIISSVVKNSPAEKAGLKLGDTIILANGIKVQKSDELISITRKHLGEKVVLRISPEKNPKDIKDIVIVPRKDFPKNEGPMGVSISQNIEVKKYPWYKAPFLGTIESLKMSWMIVMGLGSVLWKLITIGAVPKDIAGPVGIAQLTGQFVQIGPFAVLSLVALLSLNLAVLNILPIPALDGGRLFFILIEAVTRRKVNPRYEGYAHMVGMILLLALIALITFHDLTRLFSGQPLIPGP